MNKPSAATGGTSANSEKKLRDAMTRLLHGKPIRTDGRLLKENLYREAGVSRATMNRAAAVLAEWDEAVAGPQPRDADIAQKDAEIAALRRSVRELRLQVIDMQEQIVAAASVISTQHNEIVDLRGRIPTASIVGMTATTRRIRN